MTLQREVRIVFGPPGTGKTTCLLDRVEELLAEGRDPRRIAYVSFTKKAAGEARERALARFPGLTEDDLPYFSTLHSIAFRGLGLSRDAIVTDGRLSRLGEELGLTFSGPADADGRVGLDAQGTGDAYLGIYCRARAGQRSLRQEFEDHDRPFPWWAMERFAVGYEGFKRRNHLLGFEDLMEEHEGKIDVDDCFVDETQDLTRQQIDYLRRILPDSCPVTFAGDDDQEIFGWAGAERGFLGRVRGAREVLPLSYRLSRSVKCLGDSVITRCVERIAKRWESRDEEGEVDWIGSSEEVGLLNGRSWLLLARHRHQLAGLVAECRRQGVVYAFGAGTWSNEHEDVRAIRAWEAARAGKSISCAEARLLCRSTDLGLAEPAALDGDVSWHSLGWPADLRSRDWMVALSRIGVEQREYVRELRRNGEPLRGGGRVRVSTVHGAKGGEADDVLLLTDVSRRTRAAALADPDAELRVAYVGVTRARHRLLLCRPRTETHWLM
jgi:DNA helicase II / ATP-dependent DNA helicase PcrA